MTFYILSNWTRRLSRFLPWNLAAENRRLRKKLSETRYHLRAANRGAERNARMAELLVSRIRNVVRDKEEEKTSTTTVAEPYMDSLSPRMKERLEHLIQCGGSKEEAELMAQVIVSIGADTTDWSIFLVGDGHQPPIAFQLWHQARGVGIECFKLVTK